MDSPDSLILVQNLNFTYRRGTTPSLIDVALHVRAGEVLLIAGPSGCGKSTLLMLAGGALWAVVACGCRHTRSDGATTTTAGEGDDFL
jgi:energy-coupling factor transporter ATP-binding protein EcfA2